MTLTLDDASTYGEGTAAAWRALNSDARAWLADMLDARGTSPLDRDAVDGATVVYPAEPDPYSPSCGDVTGATLCGACALDMLDSGDGDDALGVALGDVDRDGDRDARDAPQSCDACGDVLPCALSPYGVRYVLDMLAEYVETSGRSGDGRYLSGIIDTYGDTYGVPSVLPLSRTPWSWSTLYAAGAALDALAEHVTSTTRDAERSHYVLSAYAERDARETSAAYRRLAVATLADAADPGYVTPTPDAVSSLACGLDSLRDALDGTETAYAPDARGAGSVVDALDAALAHVDAYADAVARATRTRDAVDTSSGDRLRVALVALAAALDADALAALAAARRSA